MGVSVGVASIVGLVFHRARADEVLLPTVNDAWQDACCALPPPPSTTPLQIRLRSALNTAGDDFLDMGRYLILGSLLAATMQTLVPQSALLAVGQTPVLSVLAMQLLAFVLSVCSTVDAFLALNFTGSTTFTSPTAVRREIFTYTRPMAIAFGAGLLLLAALAVARWMGG